MTATPRTDERDDGDIDPTTTSDANPGRTGPTGRTDEVTLIGNSPGGGSSGAAESGGLAGITGGAGGNLSGGPDVDAALAARQEAPGTNATTVGVDEPGNRSRVVGGSVAHPYGVDPDAAGGQGGG